MTAPCTSGSDTYFGPGVYFDGPELGGPFLSETLSPHARLAVEIAFGADPAGDPATGCGPMSPPTSAKTPASTSRSAK
jgi:hypothetical protein